MGMISGYTRRARTRPQAGRLRRRAARFAAVAAVVAVGVAATPSPAQAVSRIQVWGAQGDIPVRGRFIAGEPKDGIGYYRQSDRTFYVLSASGVMLVQPLGGKASATWTPVVADYDGDGISDFAVRLPQTTGHGAPQWLIRFSSTGAVQNVRGPVGGGKLVPADFTGDGRADPGTYLDLGNWQFLDITTRSVGRAVFGAVPGDIPVPGHWNDHPGAVDPVDLAVFRPLTGEWFIQDAITGAVSWYQLGRFGDIPVPAAWGCSPSRISPAVFRPSTGEWLIQNPADSGPRSLVWGTAGDIPVAGDFLGDGLADVTVWRPSDGTWRSKDLRGFFPDLPACQQIG